MMEQTDAQTDSYNSDLTQFSRSRNITFAEYAVLQSIELQFDFTWIAIYLVKLKKVCSIDYSRLCI